jgi:hypothetical protein
MVNQSGAAFGALLLVLLGLLIHAQQFHVLPSSGSNLDPCKYFENITGNF